MMCCGWVDLEPIMGVWDGSGLYRLLWSAGGSEAILVVIGMECEVGGERRVFKLRFSQIMKAFNES